MKQPELALRLKVCSRPRTAESTQNSLWRNRPATPRIPEPNSRMLPGSGVIPLIPDPCTVKASDGIVPTELSEALDGPLFSSHNTGSTGVNVAFCSSGKYVPNLQNATFSPV